LSNLLSPKSKGARVHNSLGIRLPVSLHSHFGLIDRHGDYQKFSLEALATRHPLSPTEFNGYVVSGQDGGQAVGLGRLA
jgi:hypothetical protein